MTVCALHLEITPPLLTDSFSLACKQFTARSWVPRSALFNNATIFEGSCSVFKEEINVSEKFKQFPKVDLTLAS